MPKLTSLPAELRQQILLHALPSTNCIDPRVQVLQLSHINHTLRQDISHVLKLWSPLPYITSPRALSNPPPPTLAWKTDRICLDLFSTSSVDRITWTCYCRDPDFWTHPELIAAWADAVPLLPDGVKQVLLDITPAPAAKRRQHPLTLNMFVHDRCASVKFLGGHVRDVAALVKRVEQRYGGSVEVGLTGTVSERSAWFLAEVNEVVGRELEFSGTVLRGVNARFARISEGVCRVTSRKKMWHGKRRGDKHPLEWLRGGVWSKRTAVLFAQLVHEDGEQEMVLLDDVLKIARFREKAPDGEGELVLPPTGNLRRKFQHFVAVDLNLKTAGVGEGCDRHVSVSL